MSYKTLHCLYPHNGTLAYPPNNGEDHLDSITQYQLYLTVSVISKD